MPKQKNETNIFQTAFVIREDYTIRKQKMILKGDALKSISGKQEYLIIAPPLRLKKLLGYRTIFFCSNKTGSTINFDLLFAEKMQFDKKTHTLYLDKRFMQTALELLKPDPIFLIMCIGMGALIGFVLAMFLGGF